MSEKSPNEPKRWSSTKVLDCLAYFAIAFIAIALIFKLAFQNGIPSVAQAFQSVGECLAYIICILLSFYWTMRQRGAGWNRRNMWWLICWIVATVIIIVFYVLGITIGN